MGAPNTDTDVVLAVSKLPSSSTILPAKPAQEENCPLSPSDLQFARVNYAQIVVFFKQQENINSVHELVERLKWSLAEVLVYFYPLAGRLAEAPDGFLHVRCNDEGAQFIEAEAAEDTTLEHVLLHKSPRYLQELLFPLNDCICADGRSLPLLAVQVTQLKDAVAMAFTMNHMLVDAQSAWHFINSWSEICRSGSVTIANPPFHQRFRPVSSTVTSNQKHIYLQSVENVQRPLPLSHDLQVAVFHFSKDMMARLKNHVNTQYKNKERGTIIYSSFKALAAHMWVVITRARKLRAEEETTMSLSVDCRERLVPPLQKFYFGNAILVQRVTTRAGELLSNAGIITAASLLQESIEAAQKGERIRLRTEEWMKNPSLISRQSITNIISIGSSPRLPVYETDFGFGQPLCVRSGGHNTFDGKITLYPGKEGPASVDVEVYLCPSSLQLLMSDPQFHFFCEKSDRQSKF